jgi:hypothetical protein
VITTHIAAERSTCEWCYAEPGEPCTNSAGQNRGGCHAQRWALYKNEIQYKESVWYMRTDTYAEYGISEGDKFAGVPDWSNKKKITVTTLITEPDTRVPSCAINSDELYWVDWYDIDRKDY